MLIDVDFLIKKNCNLCDQDEDHVCNKMYEADLPAYPGVDVDNYVKLCNSATDLTLRCNVLMSFALATFNNLDEIIPNHNCRKYYIVEK